MPLSTLSALAAADGDAVTTVVERLCAAMEAGAASTTDLVVLGAALARLGQAAEADALWNAAGALDPQTAGRALLEVGATLDVGATPWLQAARLLEGPPTSALAWTAQAVAAIAAQRPDDADAALTHALTLDPACRPALRLAAREALNVADYDRAADLFAAADAATQSTDLPPSPAAAEDALSWVTALARSSREDSAELTVAARRWATLRPRPTPIAPRPTDPSGRRLRVGVAQACFDAAAYAHAMPPIFRALGARCALIGCNFGADQHGAPPAMYGDAFAGWLELGGLSDAAAAEAVAAQRLDILVDLEGASLHAPMAVYARRPAPVIATWINAMCGLGPGGFDWIMIDEGCLPPALDSQCDERIARIPAPFCWKTCDPLDDAPFTPPPILRRGRPTFGAACQPFKLNAKLAATWVDLLTARPDARLILRSHRWAGRRDRDRAARILTAAGAPWDRIEIDDRSLPYADHLAWFDDIDLLLDSFPFPGPTTGFEALRRGRPVVSRSGARPAARFGWSMLRAADCGAWATEDEQDYRRVVLDLIADPAALAATCAGLRDRVDASPLCDGAGYGDAIIGLFRQMAEAAWRAAR